MGSWLNNDGLYIKYGTDKTTATKGGEYRFDGPARLVEFKLNLVGLTEVEVIQSDAVFFPAGVRIEKVEVVTDNVAATGVAIDIGLVKTDRTTEIDFQGFVSALTTAQMNVAGETVTLTAGNGVTGVGDLIGTTTAFTGYVTASRTTATAFTTGDVRVRIFYSVL